MTTLLFLIAWVATIATLLGVKNMVDLNALTARVGTFEAVVPNIRADYEALKARIAALEAGSPEEQAAIDAIVARLDASFAELTTLDESVPPVEGTSTST